jgi:hypothetical protein
VVVVVMAAGADGGGCHDRDVEVARTAVGATTATWRRRHRLGVHTRLARTTTVRPPARDNIDFSRRFGVEGQIFRT